MSRATPTLKVPGRSGVDAVPGAAERKATIEKLLRFRRMGLPLRRAAALAGVHVATVCRWQARHSLLRQALAEAAREARLRREARRPDRSVPWHGQCPLCRAKVVVRTAKGERRFWRCGRWPWCPWASWRPRAPRNCKCCGGPRYWSHSRKTISCGACGVQTGGH